MRSRIVTGTLFWSFMGIIVFSFWSCVHSIKEVAIFQGIHDNVFENSWVMKIDSAKKQVTIQTVENKTDISFEASDEFIGFLSNHKLNTIVPVTFYCHGKPDRNCNLNKPYQLFVAMRRVTPISIQKHP